MLGPAGEMVKNALEANLKLKPVAPVICPNCIAPIVFDSYVLARPDAGHCTNDPHRCSFTWEDHATYAPPCLSCGYSADHREGLGCRLEDGAK